MIGFAITATKIKKGHCKTVRRVEIDALEIRAGTRLRKDGRHDDRTDHLNDELVERLG
jgi:hypothetical protein